MKSLIRPPELGGCDQWPRGRSDREPAGRCVCPTRWGVARGHGDRRSYPGPLCGGEAGLQFSAANHTAEGALGPTWSDSRAARPEVRRALCWQGSALLAVDAPAVIRSPAQVLYIKKRFVSGICSSQSVMSATTLRESITKTQCPYQPVGQSPAAELQRCSFSASDMSIVEVDDREFGGSLMPPPQADGPGRSRIRSLSSF